MFACARGLIPTERAYSITVQGLNIGIGLYTASLLALVISAFQNFGLHTCIQASIWPASNL